jgi:hypothetical protein
MQSEAMVRINGATKAILKELSSKSGESMQDLVQKGVEALRRETLLRETNEAYARLKADPKVWKEFKKEQKAWEATLSDGLDKD